MNILDLILLPNIFSIIFVFSLPVIVIFGLMILHINDKTPDE